MLLEVLLVGIEHPFAKLSNEGQPVGYSGTNHRARAGASSRSAVKRMSAGKPVCVESGGTYVAVEDNGDSWSRLERCLL